MGFPRLRAGTLGTSLKGGRGKSGWTGDARWAKVSITMHVHPPLVLRARAPRLPRLHGVVAAVRAVMVPGSSGAPALHARDVQERLLALGLLPAEAVTGRYDRRTLEAVARFQAQHGLPVDGVPDAPTADALLRA